MAKQWLGDRLLFEKIEKNVFRAKGIHLPCRCVSPSHKTWEDAPNESSQWNNQHFLLLVDARNRRHEFETIRKRLRADCRQPMQTTNDMQDENKVGDSTKHWKRIAIHDLFIIYYWFGGALRCYFLWRWSVNIQNIGDETNILRSEYIKMKRFSCNHPIGQR